MPGAVDLGAHFICRREVFDALAAADDRRLPYEELRTIIEPRIRKYALKQVENSGGIDAYLKPRIKQFTEPDTSHAPMLTIGSDDMITLNEKFKLKVNLPSGTSTIYEPGLAAAVEHIDRLGQTIAEMRIRGKWDCLPPLGDETVLQESIRSIGWLHDQKTIADRSGFIIDGRVRCKIMGEMGQKCQPVKFNNRGFPEAFGLVYSHHANRSRLTPRSLKTYHDRVERELNVTWDELVRLYKVTYDWQTAAQKPAISQSDIFLVESVGVRVSGDARYVQIRDIMKRGGIPEYNVKDVKKMLQILGCDCLQPLKSGSQSAAWMRIDDIPRLVELDSADLPIWPNMPERREQFKETLIGLLDLDDLARAQIATGAGGTNGP